MGRIKRVRFTGQKRLWANDQFDRVFWDEFFRLEMVSERRKEMFGKNPDERRVTITIRDEHTGEKWVIEGVRLTLERAKTLSD